MALDIANTTLNASPYFDDYNENKNFHRILFRPSVAVQARELNQAQSILQNQIERFGQHIFKDGTIIKGCGISYLPDIDFVSIADQFVTNTSLSSTNTQFVNAIAVGNTTGVVAQIVAAREGFSATANPARFFVKYTQPGSNNERTFAEGEYLNIYIPGKTYIDKTVLKITSASTANSLNFPTGARIINQTSLARGFIVNAYANGSGSFVELRNVRKKFAAGETVVVSTDTNISATIDSINLIPYSNSFIDSVQVLATNASLYDSKGFAYGVAVSPGIVFHKGHFIKVESHLTIVNENGRDPAGKVLYFNTSEEIVKETTDSSLYDNASGTPNINAPGAHRLKLTSTLISRNKTGANTISNTDIAFPIVEFSNNGPVFQRTDTQFNTLGEELAKRTYEESGHYVIKPFSVTTKPDFTSTNNMVYEVTQGLAYVKGKRIELLDNLNVVGRRGTDTLSVNEALITVSYGNYYVVDEVRGYFPVNQSTEVVLYSAAQDAVSGNRSPGAAATGSIIGYANVRAVKFNDTFDSTKGKPTSQYRLYLFNIRMNNGSNPQDIRSIVYHSGTANSTNTEAFADIVLDNSLAVVKESSVPQLLFNLNARAVKNLRNSNNVFDTNYFYTAANTTAQLISGGTITFGIGALKGIVGFSDGSDSSKLLADVVLLDANASSANLAGTVAASATNIITGTTTTFNEDFVVGEYIEFIGASQTRRITAITDATTMTVDSAVTAVANTYRRIHVEGSHIALNTSAGSKRSLSVAVNRETATINLGSTYVGTSNVAVRFYAYNNEASELKKDVNRKRVVIINTANNAGGETGPWNLGIPDVFNLTGVYFGTNSSNFNILQNQVNKFALNDGQNDTHYDHATLSINPLSGLGSLANVHMLVEFDCFVVNATTGEGFFSVDSYPANDTLNANASLYIRTWEIPKYFSSTANTSYDLRDVIDFRPYKSNTANLTAEFTTATVNPPVTNTFNSNTTNYNPFPTSVLSSNFTYYLGRKDRLVLTSDKLFQVEEGLPDVAPRLSPMNSDVLNIAEVDIPPYPSLTDAEKQFVNKPKFHYITQLNLLTHKRFTMRDISILEQRIERLEYYTTLNLLEKVALQTTIADSSGNQRFQNGFFVDPFNSHVFGRTEDPDYRAAIDEKNGLLRPPFHPEIVDVEFDTNTNSYSNVQATGSMITLAYTEEVFLEQPNASEPLNVSGVPLSWAGTIDLRPLKSTRVDYLAPPAAVTGTNGPSLAYNNMNSGQNSIVPGIAQYGFWRLNIDPTDYMYIGGAGDLFQYRDTSGKAFNEIRDQTSTPIATSKQIDLNDVLGDNDNVTMSPSVLYQAKESVFAFKAYGLKPNTTHYLFIDNQYNLTSQAALGELSSTPNAQDETFVTRTTPWGTPLVSDSRGEIIGKFILPAATIKVGVHKLTLVNRESLAAGSDESIAQTFFTIDISANDPPKNPGNPQPGNTTPSSNLFAHYTFTGNTTITSVVTNGITANGTFVLTFTDDSYTNQGTITSYSWNFGAVPGLITCSSNTATGVGPHTISFDTLNSVEDVIVSLAITTSAGATREFAKQIRLTKLLQTGGIAAPGTPTNPEGMLLRLIPSLFDDYSDLKAYGDWSQYTTDIGLGLAVDTLPYNMLTYNAGLSLGSNTTLKILAQPAIDYQGNVVWTVTTQSGDPLPAISYANITQVYVTAGGSNYSNSDTIQFSNGQVDGYASIQTNTTGGIVLVKVTGRGNFTDGTITTPDSFVANSTSNNDFTLSTTSTNTSIQVAINGVLQIGGTDYWVDSGTTLKLINNGDTANTANAAVSDVVYVEYTNVVPGTTIKPVNQIRIRVSNSSVLANSTSNTSAGSGASFLVITGLTSNSIASSPRVENDILTLYSNNTFGAETKVLVKADFYLSNGYANSIGNTSQVFTLKNANTASSSTTTNNTIVVGGGDRSGSLPYSKNSDLRVNLRNV